VDLPFTLAALHVLETFQGDPGEDTIRVRLPGGTVGAWSWSLPGTPAFASGGEFVLMLDTIADGSGERRLSEFGLAKFDLVYDEGGRRFAVRPVFSPEADVQLSRLTAPLQAAAMGDGTSVWARDAESFLAALRRVSQGESMPPVAYASPAGGFVRRRPHFDATRPSSATSADSSRRRKVCSGGTGMRRRVPRRPRRRRSPGRSPTWATTTPASRTPIATSRTP
jgi:hypothetical protein